MDFPHLYPLENIGSMLVTILDTNSYSDTRMVIRFKIEAKPHPELLEIAMKGWAVAVEPLIEGHDKYAQVFTDWQDVWDALDGWNRKLIG